MKRIALLLLVFILIGFLSGQSNWIKPIIKQDQSAQKMRIPGWFTDLFGRKMVYVFVCAESESLPTMYCSDIVSKKFREDLVPTEECNIHFKKLFYSVERLKEELGRTIYLSPFLIPSLFIDSQYPWEDYCEFIDIIVENDYGNSLRTFSAGVWELYTVGRMSYPFVKVNGKFDLEQMNQIWLNETMRRIRYFVEKDGVIIYTLIDGCSLYGDRAGWWNRHWWKGSNNINGTGDYHRSIHHMFHWSNDVGLATRHYVLKFMDDMVRLLEKEFPGSIVYDFNEFDGDIKWYMEVDRKIFQPHSIPKERKMFSFSVSDYEPAIYLSDYYTHQAHGIDGLEAYWLDDGLHYNDIMFSADGMYPTDKETTRVLVYEILKSGNIGFENNRYWYEEIETIWERVDWDYAIGMKNGFLNWYQEVGNVIRR